MVSPGRAMPMLSMVRENCATRSCMAAHCASLTFLRMPSISAFLMSADPMSINMRNCRRFGPGWRSTSGPAKAFSPRYRAAT